ncbi:hypothetical protein VAR608DRAFT_1788 [Variovorax sp. HW608]|uniref:DUF4286 family protein n=1 Tax=Variovorax sp. HW608 TaxID=1034889 RepID=UPI00081FA605|nr:DUF4286 family protein [Variovorax sp. HW608]SCK22900.1 hypothetical protein VAR608DRAFT_1788 [Variovorax sp. HW608]
MSDKPAVTGAVLALWNDVTPELDAEYNDWHANEHVPERLSVPGMLWGRRYRHVGGAAAPRYLTIYGMQDAEVLESDAYRLLLDRPTPMSARMRPHLGNVSRWVCEVREMHELGTASGLSVWTFDSGQITGACATGRAGCNHGLLLARRLPQASPLPWLKGGQARSIEGSWLLALGRSDEAAAEIRPIPGALIYAPLAVGRTSGSAP